MRPPITVCASVSFRGHPKCIDVVVIAISFFRNIMHLATSWLEGKTYGTLQG